MHHMCNAHVGRAHVRTCGMCTHVHCTCHMCTHVQTILRTSCALHMSHVQCTCGIGHKTTCAPHVQALMCSAHAAHVCTCHMCTIFGLHMPHVHCTCHMHIWRHMPVYIWPANYRQRTRLGFLNFGGYIITQRRRFTRVLLARLRTR
jgi:hypothetical protein